MTSLTPSRTFKEDLAITNALMLKPKGNRGLPTIPILFSQSFNKKMKKKIYSYAGDDQKGGRAEFIKRGRSSSIPPNYIDIKDIKILLEIQNHKCYICHDPLKLDWKPRCNYHITLDRINEKNCHLKGNILLACYYCNCRCRKGRRCNEKCCKDKSDDIRKKKDVPENEILELLAIYNEKVGGNYGPNDSFKDYEFSCGHYPTPAAEWLNEWTYSDIHARYFMTSVFKTKIGERDFIQFQRALRTWVRKSIAAKRQRRLVEVQEHLDACVDDYSDPGEPFDAYNEEENWDNWNDI